MREYRETNDSPYFSRFFAPILLLSFQVCSLRGLCALAPPTKRFRYACEARRTCLNSTKGSTMSDATVRIWEDSMTLPSYILDDHSVHPQFDESHGRECYPYPLANLDGDRRKVTRKYLAVHIENEFLEVASPPITP